MTYLSCNSSSCYVTLACRPKKINQHCIIIIILLIFQALFFSINQIALTAMKFNNFIYKLCHSALPHHVINLKK